MSLEKTQTGGCLCGAVSFELAVAPTHYGACHCGTCRKFSGGIELGVEVPPDGITWLSDKTLTTFRSSEWAERGFCRKCGSSLFWRLTAEGPMQGLLSLSAGALDSLDGMIFNTEVYIDHKQGTHAFVGDHRRMTEAEVLESMGVSPDA